MNRREFIRQLALMTLLATPIGKYVVAKWREAHPPKRTLRASWSADATQDIVYRHALETGYIYAPYVPFVV